MKKLFLIFTAVLLLNNLTAKDKIPLTPPMGWMTWNMFGANINEQLIKDIADAMVSSGMAKAGYEYIVIDDLWQGKRDQNGILQPDPKKFPSGIKSLADYVHSKGLKLGIYSDAAERTCAGAIGSLGYEEIDAKTFANWGIDYFKYDYCHAPKDKDTAIERYKKMGDALQNSGRPILFAVCEWGQRQPWLWAKDAGGTVWRTTWDIRDTWDHGKYDGGHNGIIQMLNHQVGLAKYAGPGAWNDPDMLVVGLYGKGDSSSHHGANGCTDTEYQSNMSLWCLLSAPLISSNDLRNMNERTIEILTNPEAIAVNQDPLYKQADRIFKDGDIEIWAKDVVGGKAIGILNRNNSKTIDFKLKRKSLKLKGKHIIRDLWLHKYIGELNKSAKITVKSHEVRLLKIIPMN